MSLSHLSNYILNKSIELQYFPCINWTKIWIDNSHHLFLLNDPYKKRSFRNRCIIAGSNGFVNLTVPIEKGRNVRVPYREVKVAYRENWQLQHWRTITSCYGRAPWFEELVPGLEVIFRSEFEYLYELNEKVLEWAGKVLKTRKPGWFTNDIGEVQDISDGCLPSNFQNTRLKPYFQLFEDRIGFQSNLSVLDLLMMLGPGAREYLLNCY